MQLRFALVVLLTAGILIVPASASASPTECRGRPVTLTDAGLGPYDWLNGTVGPDVIWSVGNRVSAGAGDDVICYSQEPGVENGDHVDAGPGADVVDTTTVPINYSMSVDLGPGADQLEGGRADHLVFADHATAADPDVDHITLGDGDDDVGYDQTTSDVLSLGAGRDVLTLTGASPEAVIDFGETSCSGCGNALRYVNPDRLDWRVDGDERRIDVDGVRAVTWTGYVRRILLESRPSVRLDLIGSEQDEYFTVSGPGSRSMSQPSITADLGAGDDVLALNLRPRAHSWGPFDGGSGRDKISFTSETDVVLDLQSGLLADARHARSTSADRFESARVFAWDQRATIRGTRRDDRIWAIGRHVVVDAREGDDVVRAAAEQGARLSGGDGADELRALREPGRDVLIGGRGDDLLVGSAGLDSADGGPGRDECRAEVRRRCEAA
jgi:Ca2+-binding RTX toxin-like protein